MRFLERQISWLEFLVRKHLDEYGKFEAILGGHPDHTKIPGVEASTGALGHGPAIGLGMAISAKLNNLKYKTFVIVGDGEIQEGLHRISD